MQKLNYIATVPLSALATISLQVPSICKTRRSNNHRYHEEQLKRRPNSQRVILYGPNGNELKQNEPVTVLK
jgi:hypothetical protein